MSGVWADREGQHPVSRVERRWVFGFGLVVMALTMIPYLAGFLSEGEAYRFTGFVFGAEDGNSYIAKMLMGSHGAWLFRTPYTAYDQGGVVMFLPYILLGKLSRYPGSHDQLVFLYHAFRFIAGLLVILATYDFLALFVRDVKLRRSGLLLAVLGGGLGWLVVVFSRQELFGSLPLEFYSPESFGFLGLFGIPHLAMARALMLWALADYLKALNWKGNPKQIFRPAVKIGLLWLLAGLMQPLAALVIGFVISWYLAGLAAWQVILGLQARVTRWGIWRRMAGIAVLAGIMPGFYVLYNVIAVLRDPFLQMWSAQNIITSPHPLHYLVAYGLVLPFAVAGAWRLLRVDAWRGWLVVGWVILFPFLAYAPVNLQRRLPDGVWVALVTLAFVALEGWLMERPPRVKRLRFAPLILLLLLIPSTLMLYLGGVLSVVNPGKPLFQPVDEVSAFLFLRDNAPPGAVVLTAYDTGNALPAWTPQRVVIGHGPESAGLSDLLPQVSAFYASATPDEGRLDFIRRQKVNYVFWGPLEQRLGDWQPEKVEYLSPVYQAGNYHIFQVIEESR